jgi:hypothetical protein
MAVSGQEKEFRGRMCVPQKMPPMAAGPNKKAPPKRGFSLSKRGRN